MSAARPDDEVQTRMFGAWRLARHVEPERDHHAGDDADEDDPEGQRLGLVGLGLRLATLGLAPACLLGALALGLLGLALGLELRLLGGAFLGLVLAAPTLGLGLLLLLLLLLLRLLGRGLGLRLGLEPLPLDLGLGGRDRGEGLVVAKRVVAVRALLARLDVERLLAPGALDQLHGCLLEGLSDLGRNRKNTRNI